MQKSYVTGTCSAHDMVEALVEWGFMSDDMGKKLLDSRDRKGKLDVKVDSCELVDEAKTSDLLAELQIRDDFVPFPTFDGENVADGLRYFRRGDRCMAEALFAREFDDETMRRIQPVLAS